MHTLFPLYLAELNWTTFQAEGFPQPVPGVIYTSDNPPCCGVPLGGLSTGCLDLDARGVYGFSSLFNPVGYRELGEGVRLPRRLPDVQPALGLAVGGEVWVLASAEMVAGGQIPWCTEPRRPVESKFQEVTLDRVTVQTLEGVRPVRQIRYWGHYPLADLEYETDAPVGVGLRAWAPFVPGDAAASNIPALVFEVHLRNPSAQAQAGTLACNFPGPDPEEARAAEFTRQPLDENFRGMLVSSAAGVQYVLGVMGEPGATSQPAARFGGGLSQDRSSWSHIARRLPQPASRWQRKAGCSCAVDFRLEPGEERLVRFFLAWYAPRWEGANKEVLRERELRDSSAGYPGYPNHHYTWIGSPWEGEEHYFTHMYAARYGSALDVARRIAAEHESLLGRVLAWQNAVYTAPGLPDWLKDSLVNSLALLAEDSYWAQARPPLGDWAFPQGVFALNESPRGCPDLACIPCDWYGNLPVVFFFPELARTTLRAFKHFQKEDGEIPFLLGIVGDLPELAVPGYHWQVALNGMCYVDLVDRLWQRTGDKTILDEFYESVKKCNTFSMGLSSAPNAVISMPDEGGMEWFEYGDWAGMAAHMGGLRLAGLHMMARLAEAAGDAEYAQRCLEWLTAGQRAMEDELWTGAYYLNYWDPQSGKKSEDVMAYQLDGEWAARYHGFPGVFRPERVRAALDTIRDCNVRQTPKVGAANFARPDGSPLAASASVAAYGAYAMFPPEVVLLAMTYIYAGEVEFGLELARKHWENLVIRQRHPWDLPNLVRGDTGQRTFGSDYYQNLILWALPAAFQEQDLQASCGPGGLVERILAASKVVAE